MNGRSFIKILGLSAVIFLAFATTVSAQSDRPNILYIMADDHAAHAIGAYGGRFAELDPTPTLDRLAAEGMLLENCLCTNAICSPSRVCILTGQYSHIHGVTGLGGHVPREQQYLPLSMRDAGYKTAVVGKWHIGTQPEAFDYYNVLHSQGKYHNPEMEERKTPQDDEVTTVREGYCSDVITDISLEWLKSRDRSRPFFLMHHFKAPHKPWDHAQRYADLWADIDLPEPPSLWDNRGNGSIATRGDQDELLHLIGKSVSARHHSGYGMRFREEGLTDEAVTRASYQRYLKRYLRCVRGVDDNVKRLLAYLEAEGELDNTVIVYSSDQGMMLGEHDYVDKRWMYEESIRMPLIVRYPRSIRPGSRTDALVNNTDFAPTLLDFADARTPDAMQGHSFRRILETGHEPDGWRQASYYRYWVHMPADAQPAHFGVRTKQYKLIFFYGVPEKPDQQLRTPPDWELYDVRNDPHEMNNVYGNPEYKDVVETLKEEILRLREEVKDSDVERPHIQAVIDEFWQGGEEEAIRISHQRAAQGVPAPRSKKVKDESPAH
jgi:arylsulfatase A-like enzyme